MPATSAGMTRWCFVVPPQLTRTATALFSGGFEVSQIRRLLSFLRRHQKAISAHIVTFLAKQEERVALGTVVEVPDRSRVGVARVCLGDRPRAGQRVVDRRNLVDKLILVCLVEIDSLLDDGLIVIVHAHAGTFEGAR